MHLEIHAPLWGKQCFYGLYCKSAWVRPCSHISGYIRGRSPWCDSGFYPQQNWFLGHWKVSFRKTPPKVKIYQKTLIITADKWPTWPKQRQFSHLLARLFTCVWIKIHPPSHYIEDETCQIAFSWVLLTLCSGVAFRRSQTIFSAHTWLLRVHCCCWAISTNVPFSRFFRLLINAFDCRFEVISPPVGLVWRHTTACKCHCVVLGFF